MLYVLQYPNFTTYDLATSMCDRDGSIKNSQVEAQLACCIYRVYNYGFDQPKLENIWQKYPRKFQNAKLEFAMHGQLFL